MRRLQTKPKRKQQTEEEMQGQGGETDRQTREKTGERKLAGRQGSQNQNRLAVYITGQKGHLLLKQENEIISIQ